MKVVAYVPDLMDRSRFGGLSADTVFAKTVEEVPLLAEEHQARLVILDLGRPGALEAAAALGSYRVVAFASHVDTDRIAAAKAVGVQETMPRSRFFSQIHQIFASEAHGG